METIIGIQKHAGKVGKYVPSAMSLTQAQDQGHIFSLIFSAGFDFNNTFIQDLSVSINYWIWYRLTGVSEGQEI